MIVLKESIIDDDFLLGTDEKTYTSKGGLAQGSFGLNLFEGYNPLKYLGTEFF